MVALGIFSRDIQKNVFLEQVMLKHDKFPINHYLSKIAWNKLFFTTWSYYLIHVNDVPIKQCCLLRTSLCSVGVVANLTNILTWNHNADWSIDFSLNLWKGTGGTYYSFGRIAISLTMRLFFTLMRKFMLHTLNNLEFPTKENYKVSKGSWDRCCFKTEFKVLMMNI